MARARLNLPIVAGLKIRIFSGHNWGICPWSRNNQKRPCLLDETAFRLELKSVQYLWEKSIDTTNHF
jgi:hypothetical protein